jgi:hypothetical protein
MPPFTAWSNIISPMGAGNVSACRRNQKQRWYRKTASAHVRQRANVCAVDIAVHVQVEISLAVAVLVERAFRREEPERDAEVCFTAAIDGIVYMAALNAQQLLGRSRVASGVTLYDDGTIGAGLCRFHGGGVRSKRVASLYADRHQDPQNITIWRSSTGLDRRGRRCAGGADSSKRYTCRSVMRSSSAIACLVKPSEDSFSTILRLASRVGM